MSQTHGTIETLNYIQKNYLTQSDRQIALNLNCSKGKVEYCRRKAGIKKPQVRDNKTPSHIVAKVYQDYTSLKYTMEQIALRNGLFPGTVSTIIDRHFPTGPNSGMRYVLTLTSSI